MGIFGLHLPKKVDEVVGGIGRQVNPFDGGATYSNPRPAPQVARPTVSYGQQTVPTMFGSSQFVGVPKVQTPQVSAPRQSVAWNAVTNPVVLPKPSVTPQINNKVTAVGKQQPIQSKPTNQMTAQDYHDDAAGRLLDSIGLGVGRSLTGTAQSVSGLIDAVTPGKGQSHITQQLNKNAESQDARIKAMGLNNAAYKTGQIGTDIGTFLLPGATAPKLAVKGVDVAIKAPGAAKFAVRVAQAAKVLENTNKAGKVAVKSGKFLKRPDVVVNTLTDTALGTGYRSARGQDISPGTIAQDYGLSAGTQGALTGAGKVIKGAVNSSKHIDNLLKNYGDTQFGKAVSNHMATRQAAQENYTQGMNNLNGAEARANFDKDFSGAVNNDQKLLGTGSGHFIMESHENARYQTGANKLAKEYQAELDAINKKYNTPAARGSREYKANIEAMNGEFIRRHENLVNGVGEFAVQTPKPATPTNDEKLLNIKIKNVKDPQRKAELVAERDAMRAGRVTVTKQPEATPYVYMSKRKGVNAFNRAWQTVAGVLNQYGPTGEAVVQRLHAQRNAAEILKQRFYNQIPTVLKLDKHDMQFFADALETLSRGGQLDPGTPPHIQQAIKEWNGNIQSVRDLASQHGLDVGDLGPNYFPRIYKNLDSEKGFTKLRDTIMADAEAKGRPISVNEASNIAESIRSGSNKSYGNLEKTRQFDVPGYEKTHDAVTEYVNRAFDRITRAEQFGANDEFITQAYRDLQQQGYTPDHIEKVFKKYVDIARGDRDHNGLGYKTSSVVRKFNALTSLSAAGISNSTQSTNTAAVGGIGRTLKAIGNMVGGGAWGSEARQKAQETGVLLDHAIASIAEQQLGTNGKIARNIASPFFRTVEKFNRQVSAMVGADYGNHLASAGKHDVLREKFGITGKIGDKLTPAQETQMARKMVEISQFKVDPMDLPGWADSALGKLAIQFRTFGYKQTEFMYNQVLREATKGNFAPLARFVAVGVPAGVGANKARELVQAKFMNENNNDNSDQSNLKKAAGIANTGFAQVGGYGLPGTAYVAAQRASKSRSPTASIAGAVGGPTAGLAVETAQNIDTGARYKNWQPLGREAVRKIPAVGPTVANVTMPYKASEKPTAPVKGEKATPAYLEQESKKEKTTLQNRKTTDGYTLQQLSNGKYAYTLDGDTTVHTSSDLKKAQRAIAKQSFAQSDATEKTVNGVTYYKDANGDVKTKTATKPKQPKAKTASGRSGGGKINPSSYAGKISVSVKKGTPARTPTISKVAVKSRAKSGKIKVTAKKVA